MTKYKKLTRKAGITIPKDLRAEAGFSPNMAIDLIATDEGVLIKKHVPTCNLCGSIENVVAVDGFEICIVCAGKLNEAVGLKYGA